MSGELIHQGDFELVNVIDGDVKLVNVIDGDEGVLFIAGTGAVDEYTGPTTVTPSEQVQVLYTEGLKVLSDITVNAIPTNYGRITWDGQRLTVE